MRLTNKANLPESIFNAISRDPYDKGDCDFSVTELILPPRIRVLRIKHAGEIEEDIQDRLWSLYGQLAHSLLERAAGQNELVEKRIFTKIGLHTLSGQIDNLCLEHGVLSDYKFTTSWGFMADREPKEDWVQQLNMQAFLIEAELGVEVKALQIIGLLRDWQIREASKSKKYPQYPIAVMEIPIWRKPTTHRFILERMALHMKALSSMPRECSVDERWRNNIRCMSYCNVNKFCDFYRGINGQSKEG